MITFLIADNSDTKGDWLEAMVKKSGLTDTIIRAHTTEEAQELIDKRKPTAAFIDYEMPSENGPAVIAYLQEKVPSAKIAMVSSSNSERYQTDAEAAGAKIYICTSFEEEDVIDKVMDTLEEWKN